MLGSCLVAHGRLAPGGNRRGSSDGGLALSSSVRMVAGVHYGASYMRSYAHVALSSCLTDVYILVVDVADLTDCSHALRGDITHLAGGKPYLYLRALPAHKLSHVSCRPDKLCALAGVKLDVVDKGTYRDADKGKGVAGLDVGVGACAYYIPDL